MRYLSLLILFLGLMVPWVAPDISPTDTDTDSYTDAALDCSHAIVPVVSLDLADVENDPGELTVAHEPGCNCCSADSATHQADDSEVTPLLAVLHFGTSALESTHRSDAPIDASNTDPTVDWTGYGYQAPDRMDC